MGGWTVEGPSDTGGMVRVRFETEPERQRQGKKKKGNEFIRARNGRIAALLHVPCVASPARPRFGSF